MTPPQFSAADFHAALETAAVGRFLLYRTTTESTMILARREAGEGAPHGTLVLAEEQTAGRGRRGRSFFSPPGENLYFTFVLRLPFDQHRRLPIILPVAVSEALAAEGVDVRIKWPNDIWAGQRKLCGMLIDAELTSGGALAMAGIGINVNGDPTFNPELRETATSVARALGREVSREALLARICNAIEVWLRAAPPLLASRYESLSMIIGREITIHPSTGEAYEARATAIDPDGALCVVLPGGLTETIVAADVSVRPRHLSASVTSPPP
jgi:BirA family transcriptional regulator, biotin operon repressor / biotin---[acetyl-CoA-carboxylase] ligase